MGTKNEHKAFLVTEVKNTITQIVPSVDMDNDSYVNRRHILDAGRVSIVANHPTVFPEDPEENEIVFKDNQFWIFKNVNNILDWVPIGDSGSGGPGDTIAAENVIESDNRKFVNNEQHLALTELVDGLIPAQKIIQDGDHRFLNDSQVNSLNNIIDGIFIDGGDLPTI